ncbi:MULTISPECIES: hypothetical protein [unclassified Nocardia]|uniref:hypothetical protein n=1 Tax=unclassified Nocardia TaxID=2637762 RepID=UPI001C4FFF91|nr:hypothetical protein [Nocardia sp. MH4]
MSIAVLMLATSATLAVLSHLSDPFATEISNSNKIIIALSAISALVFSATGVTVCRQGASANSIRIAKSMLWINIITLAATEIALLATGSMAVLVWMVVIGVGFDLSRIGRR